MCSRMMCRDQSEAKKKSDIVANINHQDPNFILHALSDVYYGYRPSIFSAISKHNPYICCPFYHWCIFVKTWIKRSFCRSKIFVTMILVFFSDFGAKVTPQTFANVLFLSHYTYIHKGPLILRCQMIIVDCPTNFECTLVNCHLKLIWSLNFEIVLRIDIQMALFSKWWSSAKYWWIYQTKSNTTRTNLGHKSLWK